MIDKHKAETCQWNMLVKGVYLCETAVFPKSVERMECPIAPGSTHVARKPGRHLVVNTHRTYVGSMRQVSQNIHEMIVTANRTCVLPASEDMITQSINTNLAETQRAALSVGKHLGDRRPEAPAENSLPNVRREVSQNPLC